MKATATDSIHYLENVGRVGLGIDKETREILVMLQTPMGVLSESLSQERAVRLGVELIRASGQTFRFPVQASQPADTEDPNVHAKDDDGPGGDYDRSSGPVCEPGGSGADVSAVS